MTFNSKHRTFIAAKDAAHQAEIDKGDLLSRDLELFTNILWEESAQDIFLRISKIPKQHRLACHLEDIIQEIGKVLYHEEDVT